MAACCRGNVVAAAGALSARGAVSTTLNCVARWKRAEGAERTGTGRRLALIRTCVRTPALRTGVAVDVRFGMARRDRLH